MGFLDDPRGALGNFQLEDKSNDLIKNITAKPTKEQLKTPMEAFYPTDNVPSNWFKALPYGFKFTPRGSSHPITIFLPISPSNLTIVTHYATNVVTTLYGTVEEHSEQRYFDIVIEGSTGMSPRYTDITAVEGDKKARLKSNGRQSFSAAETIPSGIAGGFFAKTIGSVNQALNRAADVLAPAKNTTGVHVSRTGYAAFHNLYKFFLLYKRNISGVDTQENIKSHPLIFFNYKDNNKYNCAIQKFTLRRSVDDPMLYFYSIELRAYKLEGADKPDGLADFDLNTRRAELGLDGVDNSSIFNTVKNISKGAKDFVGALSGGLNTLGG